MVLVKVDGNFIDAEPIKNRSEGAMIKAYQALWTRLTASGTVKPKTHILDNEASAEFKKEIQNRTEQLRKLGNVLFLPRPFFKKEIQKNCTIQLVPLDNHRQNLAD